MFPRKLYLIVSLISIILLLILSALVIFDKIELKSCACPNVVSNNLLALFIILSVIFVSTLFYYLFTLKINQKEKIIKSNFNIIYSILDDDEKKLFDLIVLNKGKINQLDVSKKFGKIKGHRLIQKLKLKNIIKIKKTGSRNQIYLKKEFLQVIKK